MEQVRDELIGDSFSSQLRRYVGMDLIEDKFDDSGNHVDKALPHIKRLAAQLTVDATLLEQELHWLVTDDAKNAYQLATFVGEQDIGGYFTIPNYDYGSKNR